MAAPRLIHHPALTIVLSGRRPPVSPNRPMPQRAAPASVPKRGQPMRRFAKGSGVTGKMSKAQDAKLDKKAGVKQGSPKDRLLDTLREVPGYAKGTNKGNRLSAAQRRAIPSSEYGIPGSKKFPITDAGHARSALGHINAAPPADRARIRRMADAKLRGKK